MTTKTRTKQTATGTSLRVVPLATEKKVTKGTYRLRRVGALAVALSVAGLAVSVGVSKVETALSPLSGDSVKQYAQTLANRTANAGEICTLFYPNGANEPELIKADGFADGSEDIRGLAYDAAAMKDPAVCRPESSTDLGDNRAVPSENVPEGQMVSPEEFAEFGGVSSDVG